MDFSSFSEADFDLKAWVNASIADEEAEAQPDASGRAGFFFFFFFVRLFAVGPLLRSIRCPCPAKQ